MLLQAELAALKLETGLNRSDRTPASETSPGDLTIEVKRLRLKLQHRGMELLGKTQQVQELQQQLEALKQAMASLEATLAQQHSPEQQVPEALASTATKVLQEHMQVQQVLPQLQEVQASQQQQPQQQEDDGGSQAQSEPAVHPPGQPQPHQQQGGGDLQPAPAVVARLQIQQQGGKAQSKTQQPHRSQKPQTQQQQHGSGSAKISLAASGIHPRQLQVHQDKAQALAQWKQPQLKQQQEQHGHVNVHTTLDASVLKPPHLCAEKPVPQVQQQQGVGTPKVHIPPAASKLAAPVSLLGQLQAQQPQQQQQPPSRSGSLKSQTFNRDAGATADHPKDSMLTASSRNGGLSRIHSAHVRELREWLERQTLVQMQ